jgi:hypothetical protein
MHAVHAGAGDVDGLTLLYSSGWPPGTLIGSPPREH